MFRSVILAVFLGQCARPILANEPMSVSRPISEADSVVAVYYDDWTRGKARPLGVILAAWPDGRVVWSGDNLRGGPPYKEGRVDPKKMAALLRRFEVDGLFATEDLKQQYIDPHRDFLTVIVKVGSKQVKLVSDHEVAEETEGGIAMHWKVSQPPARRLNVLHDAPREYLLFRVVWSDTRARLADLIPPDGTPSDGKPVMKGGILSWHESAPRGK